LHSPPAHPPLHSFPTRRSSDLLPHHDPKKRRFGNRHSMNRSRFLLLSAFFTVSGLTLAACTPLGIAVGAGATAGVAAQQEGGLNAAASDAGIRAQINQLWFEKDIEMMRRVGLSVSNGRVLLTGVVPKPEDRVEAVRLVWQVQGVREDINEIRADGEEG